MFLIYLALAVLHVVAAVLLLGHRERKNNAALALVKAEVAVIEARSAYDDYMTECYLDATK